VFFEAVQKQPERPWSVPDLAVLAGLSESRFRTLFRAAIRRTPRAYLIAVRMDHAASLLATASLTVKEVAATVGLDMSHFVRGFRRRFGVSPRAYRLGARGGALAGDSANE
jgi:transcriptional regulator GlxA family with amidase domain